MKMSLGLIVGILIGAASVIGGYFYLTSGSIGDDLVKVTFTEAEIQEKIGRKFPKTERILEIFPIEIQEPRVKFLSESDRLQLSADATLVVPFVGPEEITLICTGSVDYENEDKSLRISDVTVEQIKTRSLPGKYEEPVRLALTAAARKYLEDYVIHTLKPKDYKGKMAEMFVKKIKVKKGLLEVTLGL